MADGYVLYGSRGSGSASVEVALHACGVPFRKVRASNWEEDSAVGELQKVNPLKQIPTLVLPDGTAMAESAAILVHLGLLHPGSGLLPQEPVARARCLHGLVYIPANCYSAITILDYPERFTTSGEKADHEAIRAGTRAHLHRNWDLFADLFDRQPYLTGEQPGALDFFAAVVSRWSGTRQHLEQSRPAFFATLKRIDTHPLVAPVFKEHWPT